MGDLGTRFHLSINCGNISPWLLILLNFCSILQFSDAANLYIPDYPTSSCAPPPAPAGKMGSSTSTVSPGEGTATGWATGRLVWVTGKKGCVVFIVLCLREPPPHPQTWSDIIHCFQYPRCQKAFFLSSFSSNICPYWWSFYLEDYKSHSEPKGVPEGQILILTWSHRSVWWSLGVFSLLCGLLSPLHGSRMFQQKYGSHVLELRCVF